MAPVGPELIDVTSVASVAERVMTLLEDPVRARAMGEAGPDWVEKEWRWDVLAQRLRGLLAGP